MTTRRDDPLGGLPGTGSGAEGPESFLLEDLLERPELLAPPVAVVPRFLYRERITLLAGGWKAGKSTLVRDIVAAASAGRSVLKESTAPARVLWAVPDEPLGDAVRGLQAANPDPSMIRLVTPPCTSAQLITLALEHEADAVIVDTLSDLAYHEADGDENDALAMKRFLAPWRQAAREHGLAVCLLHHTGKQTGRSRGSGVIDAIADLILTLSIDADDKAVRLLAAQGRVAVQDFRVIWGASGFELADQEVGIMQQVRMAVWARPGISKRGIVEAVPRKATDVYAAINALLATGELVNLGTGNRFELHLGEQGGKHPGKHSTESREPAWESLGSGREAVSESRSASFPVGGSAPREAPQMVAGSRT